MLLNDGQDFAVGTTGGKADRASHGFQAEQACEASRLAGHQLLSPGVREVEVLTVEAVLPLEERPLDPDAGVKVTKVRQLTGPDVRRPVAQGGGDLLRPLVTADRGCEDVSKAGATGGREVGVADHLRQ